uniref:Secreted protein n=1 Tax=Peronospora matthiolae TaxID=2874970 RepID=A0AAV1UMS9_9STRA
MIFASGLVLAAVAVTAANAGNPSNLRTTDEATTTNGDKSLLLDHYPSGSEDIDPDDLTIDLTEILGESTDGSHIKLNILDLIGSGSDQVDIDDIIEAFRDPSGDDYLPWLDDLDEKDGSQEHHHHHHHHYHHHHEKEDNADMAGSGNDLMWINDWISTNAGSRDTFATKGPIGGAAGDIDSFEDSSPDALNSGSADPNAAKAATKGSYPYGKGQGSGDNNMAWLFEDDGSVDPSATKGGAAFVTGDDPVATKGGLNGAGVYHDDLTSGSTDPVASKASKASKKGAVGPIPVYLFNDGSNADIDEKIVEDDNHSFMFAGATKGSSPVVEDDDDNSKSDADVSTQDEPVQTSSVDPVATKSTK